jgi:hypothetical protein
MREKTTCSCNQERIVGAILGGSTRLRNSNFLRKINDFPLRLESPSSGVRRETPRLPAAPFFRRGALSSLLLGAAPFHKSVALAQALG